MKFWSILAIFLLVGCGSTNPSKEQNKKRTITLVSELDGEEQPVLISRSIGEQSRPLVVVLHPWSSNHLMIFEWLIDLVQKKNYNMVHPNFRGAKPDVKGCCSEYVIDDIDASISWALDSMNVDRDSIFVFGASGGGYTTLCMFMRSRHDIASFSAYVPISNLLTWYSYSDSLGLGYAADILKCSGCPDGLDTAKVLDRSPIHWIKDGGWSKGALNIYAGIHDGHNGPVPIDHSIDFYNELIRAKGAEHSQLVSPEEKHGLMTRQPLEVSGTMIGDKELILERQFDNVRLVIFDGGHEFIVPGLLDRL